MKRSESLRSSKKRTAIVLSAALFLSSGLSALVQTPAEAYYYPFYYRGLGGLGNILYPLRYATYPLLGLTGPASVWTSATPYRLATGRLTGYPYMYGPQMLKNYNDEEPMGYPRQRVKQKRFGQEFGVDEVNHAQWPEGEEDARLASAPQTVPYVQGATPGQLSVPTYPPGANFGVPSGAAGYPAGVTPGAAGYPAGTAGFAGSPGFSAPQLRPDGSPPTAPPIVAKGPVTLAPNVRDAASTGGSGTTHSPLADGFVNHINSRFEGNIEAALFDPDTRKYARVLGLVSDDNLFGIDFTNTRVELVRQILTDNSLDSVSKLGAIKILLNSAGSANRAKR